MEDGGLSPSTQVFLSFFLSFFLFSFTLFTSSVWLVRKGRQNVKFMKLSQMKVFNLFLVF